ncbi:MAG TPA: aminotransferase class V-fold PLP-dependent enzyme [Trebonia sp.]|nr:aminotransferase class V-fold PLP-dependent enzyme [Trebonia sp.]
MSPRRLLPLAGDGLEVPVPGGRLVPYAHFDYAASAPSLLAVQDAVTETLSTYGSVHRGAGYTSQLTTRRYERAREVIGQFVGARERDAVIFTRNTTDAMNLLAHIAPRGTTVVVFESEHHAALLPWERRHRTVRLPLPPTPEAAVLAADEALAAAPVGPRLLVVTAASNVTGELWPVAELARVARRNGARIGADVAQLVPHRPVSMTGLDLDYVAFSGHKLYAPYGAGCLVGRADWPRAAAPYLYGGGASAAVGVAGVSWTADPAQRHEAGTPNVAGAVAIAAACEALASRDAVVAEEVRLLGRLRDGLAGLPGLTQLSLWGPRQPRVGIVAFTVDGWEAGAVARVLSRDYGIGVRDGRFCAHLLVDRLAGRGGTAVRASIGLGTVDEHVDRLLAALAVLSGASRGEREALAAGLVGAAL